MPVFVDTSSAVDINKLTEYVSLLKSSNSLSVLTGARNIRRLLSGSNPPIQKILDQRILPDLLNHLQHDNNGELRCECSWIITNIASGPSSCSTTLVNSGALEALIYSLSSPDPKLSEQCIWAIGNIAGDSITNRNIVLKTNAPDMIIRNGVVILIYFSILSLILIFLQDFC